MDILFDPSVLLRQSALTSDGKTPSRTDSAALHKACQQFESILLGSMFKEMRATVPGDGLLNDDDGGMKTYQSLMDQEVASQLAQKQSVGIADVIYRQLAPKAQGPDSQDPSPK